MILQELHGASSNQLTAPLYSETPSVEQGKLFASSLALFLCSFTSSLPHICSDNFTDNLMDLLMI